MRLKIYAIKDTKVAFMTPVYYQNDAVAMRDVKNAVNDPKENIINKNIDDIQLWKLGEFDDQTGEIISQIEFVANAIELKETKDNGIL